ncbi:hypothetical protein [Paenibacillus agricola]|uniref:hypothetical protein n=1 Tax=Paenibacillus agricola TaxID=2716264 RepID=UPI001A9FA371|nr:hypothetical protein [Paenibacillus agricola]
MITRINLLYWELRLRRIGDGKDVYALCDGNVAYQIHFIEAIRRQWLAPFT